MKNLRVIAALLLAFGHLFLAFPAQAAQTGTVQVTCAKNGVQSTYQVGWDNSNQFFMNRGNIAALYCEGGYSPLGQGATYVSDTLTNNALRYYNGVAPEPSPAPEPTSTVSPEPPSQSEQLPDTSSPDLSSTSSETVSPEVDPSESASVEPTPTSSESSPIESQSPQVEPTPTESPEPEQPTESPTLSPQPESSSPQPTPIMWDYVVDEGGVLEAQAPTGMVFSRVVARYVAHDSDCGIDVSEIVSAALVGSSSGTINADNGVFGDPCPGWYKKLVVSVEYTSAVVVPPVISPEPSQPPVLPPQPTPQPEPSPEPQPEPSPEPSPVEPTPTPTPEPQPEITPSPEPTPEPPQPEEPTEPVPTSEPTPVPEPEEPAPTVDPEPEPSPEPEPEPSEEPEPAPTTPEDVTFDTPIEDVVAVLEDVVPTSLTEEQAAVLVSIALETFETAEQGSPEYEAALDLLLVAAQQDDVVLDEALAAIPLLGNVAGAAVEVFNALGNAGADMSPQVREQSEKVVIAAVIVGQIALTATSAATSAAAAAARRP